MILVYYQSISLRMYQTENQDIFYRSQKSAKRIRNVFHGWLLRVCGSRSMGEKDLWNHKLGVGGYIYSFNSCCPLFLCRSLQAFDKTPRATNQYCRRRVLHCMNKGMSKIRHIRTQASLLFPWRRSHTHEELIIELSWYFLLLCLAVIGERSNYKPYQALILSSLM